MANKVTGKTDASGALSVAPKMAKSLVIVGVPTGEPTVEKDYNKMFNICGTSDAKDIFGEESPVVKMVKVLVTNGVDNISGVLVDPTTTSDVTASDNYTSALQATLGDKTVKVVLLDSNEKSIISTVKTHLVLAEKEDMFRYSVFAPDATVDAQADIITFANNVNDKRIFVPNGNFVDDNGNDTPAVVVMAGLASAIMTETDDPALPMNGVTISGIGSVKRPILESEKNLLAQAGVAVLYNDGVTPTIYRLVTSVKDDAAYQEGTTIFIADYVLEGNENLLRANYKRTKNVARILDSIRGDIKVSMENFQALEIIENFDETTLTVVKDPSDLYGALVDYEFDVVTPLYTITINQHMKL